MLWLPYSLEDVRLVSRHQVIFPSDPEPQWLTRKAATRALLDQVHAEDRVARAERRPRIATRLRLALARR